MRWGDQYRGEVIYDMEDSGIPSFAVQVKTAIIPLVEAATRGTLKAFRDTLNGGDDARDADTGGE